MTKPKSKPWWIYASRNPEDSYGSTIIQDRALEGADSKELAELAANQFKGTLYAGDAALLTIGVSALWKMGKTIGALPTLGRVAGGIATGVPKGTVGYMAGKYIDQKHPFGENSGVASEVLSRLLGFTSLGVGAKAGEKVTTKIGKSIGDKIDKVNRGVEKYFVHRYFNRLDPNGLRMIPTPTTNTGDDVIRTLGDNIPTTSQSNLGQSPVQSTSPDANFDWDAFISELDPDYTRLIGGANNDISIGRIPQQGRSVTGPRWTFLDRDSRVTISDILDDNSVRWHSGTIGPNFTNRRNGVNRILVQPADGEPYIMQSDLPGSPFRRVNETRGGWSNVSNEFLDDILDMPGDVLEFDAALTEFSRRLNDPNTPGDQLYNMTMRHFGNPGFSRVFKRAGELNFINSEFVWEHGRGFVFRPSATPYQVRDAINSTINSAPRGSVFLNGYSENSLPLVLRAPINNYGTGSGQMRIIPLDGSVGTNSYGRGVTFSDLFSENFLRDPRTPQYVKDWHSSFINSEINPDQVPEDVRSVLTQRVFDLYNKSVNRAVNKNQQLWNRARTLDSNLPEFTFNPYPRNAENILNEILISGHSPLRFEYPQFIIQKYNKGGKTRFKKFSRINN